MWGQGSISPEIQRKGLIFQDWLALVNHREGPSGGQNNQDRKIWTLPNKHIHIKIRVSISDI